MNARLPDNADNKFMHKLTQVVLAGFALSLPLHQHINTWFLVALVLICAYQSWVYRLGRFLRKNWILLAVPALLLIIRILGIPYAIDVSTGIKETTRALSFLLLPFSFLVLCKTQPQSALSITFKSLVIGCLLAVVICWGYMLYDTLLVKQETFYDLLRWKKSNVHLTDIIGIHPPYLGAIVLTATIYLFSSFIHHKKTSLPKRVACVLVFVFVVFLFHLVARNTLLFLLIVGIAYSIYYKRWKELFIGTIIVGALAVFIVEEGTVFLQRKYYKMLDLSDEKIGDKRFERLQASWNVFLMQPIIGVGMENDDKERVKQYEKMGDTRAAKNRHNAHNQYMEYLSTFGIIGFFTFLGVLFFLMRRALFYHDYLIALLLTLFMFACLTESFLERELGIKYFNLLIGLLIFTTCQKKTIKK